MDGRFIVIMMMIFSVSSYAERQDIIFTPLTPVAFTMTKHDVALVRYSIRNNTPAMKKLNVSLVKGMKSLKGDGLCGVGVVLLAKKSCMLSLQLTGSQMEGDIKHLPYLCAPDLSSCYYPEEEDQMDIILK